MCKQDPGDAGLFSFSFSFFPACILYGHSGLTFHTLAMLSSSATEAVTWLRHRGCCPINCTQQKITILIYKDAENLPKNDLVCFHLGPRLRFERTLFTKPFNQTQLCQTRQTRQTVTFPVRLPFTAKYVSMSDCSHTQKKPRPNIPIHLFPSGFGGLDGI